MMPEFSERIKDSEDGRQHS